MVSSFPYRELAHDPVAGTGIEEPALEADRANLVSSLSTPQLMGHIKVLHDILTAPAEEAAALACIARPNGQEGEWEAVVWERRELCTAAGNIKRAIEGKGIAADGGLHAMELAEVGVEAAWEDGMATRPTVQSTAAWQVVDYVNYVREDVRYGIW